MPRYLAFLGAGCIHSTAFYYTSNRKSSRDSSDMTLSLLSAISGSSLVSSLVFLVVFGLILWLLIWFIAWIGLPEPFAKVAKVIIGLVALILLINFLLGLVGEPFIRWQ